MTLKREILLRVGLLYMAFFLLAVVILGKVIYIQVIEGHKWREKAQELTLRDIIITPDRGNIYDEEGRLLASSIPYYDIYMDMKCPGLTNSLFVNKIDSLSYCLSNLFKNKTKNEYKHDLLKARQRGDRYYPVKKKVNYLELSECKKFPIFRLGRYKGGVIYDQENSRFYPHRQLASRTLGYLTKSISGNVVGLEGAYDSYLKGVEGVRLMQKISGNTWMPVNDRNEIEPKDGNDIITTLNINLQDVAHHSLLSQLKRYDAEYGCVVLMEVKTGEIKAIVNLKKTRSGDYAEEFNYAIGKAVEPGSTFKLVSLMAALEDRKVDITDSVDIGNGVTYYYDKKVTDSESHSKGVISVKHAFEISSNVGISKIITKSYKNKERAFIDRILEFGINNKLGLEIKGEAQPYIKYPDDPLWSGISLPQISMGYEVNLTPLQILTFYNAVANNGKMIKPMFVKEVHYHGKNQKTFKPEVLNHSVCSRSTIRKAQELLSGVVQNGTARKLNDTPFQIAGKTGTAKLYDKDKGYYVSEYEASFVGYFPAEEPQYSCIVVVHKPSIGSYYGADVAAPVFKEIAHKVYASKFNNFNIIAQTDDIKTPYTKSGNRNELETVLSKLDIPMEKDDEDEGWVTTKCKADRIATAKKEIIPGLVPNVLEMGAKDALFLLENSGLRVRIIGRGTVVRQSILPGTKINKDDYIEIEMSKT